MGKKKTLKFLKKKLLCASLVFNTALMLHLWCLSILWIWWEKGE